MTEVIYWVLILFLYLPNEESLTLGTIEINTHVKVILLTVKQFSFSLSLIIHNL